MREPPWMLVTHHQGDVSKAEVGVRAGGVIRRAPDEIAGKTMLEVLGEWDELAPTLRALDPERLDPVPGAVLTAPLLYPRKVLCAGANYYAHLAEMGVPRPAGEVEPYFFFKPPTTSVVGPDEPIVLPPRAGRKIDWEVELAAVIGRRCVDVPVERALDVVAGWTVVNDISSRDLLDRSAGAIAPPFGHDWVGAKAGDTFCPLGPGIVPTWMVADPQDVALRLTVNGVAKQDSSTTDMVTPIDRLIAAASRAVTLEPGDVIATGTPSGVGLPRGEFLAPGDETVAEIDGVGALRNPVTDRTTEREDVSWAR